MRESRRMMPVIFITFALIVLAAAESNDEKLTSTAACSMPPDHADCGGVEERWFFDTERQMCTAFTYRGCNNSPNNFESKEECENICESTDDEREFAELSVEEEGDDDTVSDTVMHLELDDDIEEPIESEQQPEQEDDEKYFEEISKEQDHLAEQFDMADTTDMLTLNRLMQSPTMDVGEIIEEEPEADEEAGDIQGVLYKQMPEGDEEVFEEDVISKNEEEEQDDDVEPTEKQDFEEPPRDDNIEDDREEMDTEEDHLDDQPEEEIEEDHLEDQAEDELVDEETEEEYLRETEQEQDALMDQFGMGDKDDIITLETLMQTNNMDIGQIVDNSDGTETGQVMGYLYKQGYQPQQDIDQETYGENENVDVREEYEENVDEREIEPQEEIGEEEPNEEAVDEPNERDESTQDEDIESANVETEEDENEQAIIDTLNMEERLEKDFQMADVKDLLTLEQMLQSDNMDLTDIMNRDNVDDIENGDVEGYMLEQRNDESENEQNTDEEEPSITYEENEAFYERNLEGDDVNNAFEEVEQNEAMPNNREQFNNFDNGVYDEDEGFHMNYNHAFQPEENMDESHLMSAEVPRSDPIDEINQFEQNDGQNEEESDNEKVLKLEEHIENRFNMADPADLIALEGLVQKPQIDLMEFMPNEKNEGTEGGHIDGVLSYAASFLGKDDQRDIQGLRQHLRDSFSRVNREGLEDSEDNAVEQGDDANDIEVRPTTQPMLAAIEKANYKDKQTLITMLHNDLFKMNKVKGSFLAPKEGNDEMSSIEEEHNWRKPRRGGEGKRLPKCCRLPKDPGPCKARKLQWHYDPFVATCLPFHYGGCAGNRNRFDTIGACLMKCGGAREIPEKSLPEPMGEPAPFHPPTVAINSFVSNLFPKKVFKPSKFMSNGQDKFLRMIGNAMKHVSEIKPVQISPITARVYSENDDDKRPPIPLKSVMFKWPIVRMIFDKRSRSGKILPPLPPRPAPEAREGPVREEIFPAPRFPPPREARLSLSPEKRFPPPREMRPEIRPEVRPEPRREMRPHFERSSSKHFSPSYSKQFKAMSHHEDNRHHMTSDPKNKVNLIQVFVNKPHNEAKAEPQHHHTMIKKHQFSSGGDYHAMASPHHSGYYGPPPPYHPMPSYQFHPPGYAPPRFMSQHEHTHEHSHHDQNGDRYSHTHSHDPHHHHHVAAHRQPWWSKKPYPFHDSREMKHSLPPQFHPNIRPSTSYPEVEEVETEVIEEEGGEFEEGTDENVVVVTVPPGDDNDEPHYACLLPLSTGMCKAFEEKFYYNIETRSCELFFYGGCGGNANNFNTRSDCEQTCMRTTPVSADGLETTTVPDDTIYITSPVYEPNAREESDEKSRDHSREDDDVKMEESKENEVNDDMLAVDSKFDMLPEHIEVFAEPVARGTEHRELLVAVVCFVALAAAALVCLAAANLVRRKKTSKKEKVIEAVLASHLERGGSSGSQTPRMLYYGQPPSETGPPPITDIPKLHQDSLKEQA